MKWKTNRWAACAAALILLAWPGASSLGDIAPGKSAPPFSAEDLQGVVRDLGAEKDRPMLVLYFFEPEDGPSREGLLSLNRLAVQYKDTDLRVWAITAAPEDRARRFAESTGLQFPVLADAAPVSALYGADAILPTACVVGPGLKILDHIQGGGRAAETILVRIAERELQRKETRLAQAISEEVIAGDPKNVKARAVKGHAALREGRVRDAEAVFRDMAQQEGEGVVLGNEGLAAVYAKKGDVENAVNAARVVEAKAPERGFVHVVKGNLLYAQNREDQARAEYEKAVRKNEAAPYLQGVRYNQLGRYHAEKGDFAAARELYDQALAIDPYYVEATSNKGMTYEKEGDWSRALETYRGALRVNANDPVAAVLARKAQERLELEKDKARSERVDRLVKELAERYRKGKSGFKAKEDEWTSRPMILTFVGVEAKGGLPERDGLGQVFVGSLADRLNASSRVRVVERVVLDRLLEELNLGSSELADPETALKLGRVLAARLVGTGSLLSLTGGTFLSMRLIDTETTAIPMIVNRPFDTGLNLDEELYRLNREILKTVMEKYPLRGYVVDVSGDRVMLNLGSNHGVVAGTAFDVIEDPKPLKFKGKELQREPQVVARIRVERVEPDVSICKVEKREKEFKAEAKVEERIDEPV